LVPLALCDAARAPRIAAQFPLREANTMNRDPASQEVVVHGFFDVMNQHQLAPADALMAVTAFVLAFMQALERNGDVAVTAEEQAQRAVEWFSHVQGCVARGEAISVGLTGLPQ